MRTELSENASERAFRKWLGRKRGKAIATNLLLAAASFAAGIAVLTATFFFTYAVVWLGNSAVSAISEIVSGRRLRLSQTGILILCGCFLGLLFVENARARREYYSDYPPPRARRWTVWPAGVSGALIVLLANSSASARMITDILLSGPRLMTGCVRALRRMLVLMGANLHTLGSALRLLARRPSPVPAMDFSASGSREHPDEILSQLVALEAVVFTRMDPPTVILDADLRDQLQPFLSGNDRPRAEHGAE